MQNLEAKFKLKSLERARIVSERIGYRYQATLHQRDTFFRVSNGKLKLREEGAIASLIRYGRSNVDALELSTYHIVAIAQPEEMRQMLADALGVLSTVRKERVLMLNGRIRFHLDNVEGLGEFGEIEAVLDEGEDPEGAIPQVRTLLDALGIEAQKLIAVSYFEMLRPVG